MGQRAKSTAAQPPADHPGRDAQGRFHVVQTEQARQILRHGPEATADESEASPGEPGASAPRGPEPTTPPGPDGPGSSEPRTRRVKRAPSSNGSNGCRDEAPSASG